MKIINHGIKYLSIVTLGLFLLRPASAFVPSQVSSTKFYDVSPSTTSLNFDPKSLLYAEQEKLLVQRGKFEGELLSNSQHPAVPLEANIVKGAGGGGGFGGGDGGSKKSLLKTQGKAHASTLKKGGVVRIDNVLPAKLADEIRQSVYEMRKESEELVSSGEVPSIARFADVLLKKNRCDMTIPLGTDDEDTQEWVPKALTSVLVDSSVGSTIQTLLGNKATLREWSCLMSDPSSNRQVMHPDTPHKKDPVLYTCFIALQDISLDMGPTTWMPKTHDSAELHAQFQDETKSVDDEYSPKDKLLASNPTVLGTLSKGSCAIFDSRLLHAGGANTSNTSRALLYFTFQNPKITNPGNPGSIRSNLINKWTLQKLLQELTKFQKGKKSELHA
jgi:ectoine hydroxylase-related dioxygenase (phytanoyl-CoA dioxygenase family)